MENLQEAQHPILTARETRLQKAADRKEKRRAKKAARKEAYRALSGKRKVWFWGKRALIVLICLCVLAAVVAFTWQPIITAIAESMYEKSLTKQASMEEILEVARPDETGAARIADIPPYSSSDTWAIYVYMCGSNLESFGENDLSDMTAYLLGPEAAAYTETQQAALQANIYNFVTNINELGMDLPDSMYLPQKPQQAQEEDTNSQTTTKEGCATADLKELFAVALPENIRLVIQTGGATRWSHAQFNPNRSQRFLYDTKGLHLLSDSRVQNMGTSETLENFLSFCKEDYPADHTMMLFWNHGSGPFGLCNDELFSGDNLTLKEMQDAFKNVYVKNPQNPPFELIGFDACLMASAEVADTLYGYGRYIAGSEELEPGDGWNHTTWLSALAAHPEMNGAQLGKVIADSYIEFFANRSIQLSWAGIDYSCTFSVLDVNKAHDAFDAYGRLAGEALKSAIADPLSMAELARAADRSVRYAGTEYHVFNTVDLGLLVENLLDTYPVEAGDAMRRINDCVLYSRATSYGRDSQGISIYFPAEVSEIYGLAYFLDYIENVCQNPDVKALYYYKVAGCLDAAQQAYADSKNYGTARALDTSALRTLAETPVTFLEDGNFALQVSADVMKLIQGCTLFLGEYVEDESRVTNYGEDLLVYTDEDGNLTTGFDGKWFSIDGHTLALQKIMETDSVIQYRAPVNVNGEDSYLLLAYDRDAELMSVLGIQKMDFSAVTASRNMDNVKPGDTLKMMYRIDDPETGDSYTEYGKSFLYKADARIEPDVLPDGIYLSYIAAYDLRGNEYYSPVVQFTMQNGTVCDAKVSDEFINIRTE